MIVPRLVQPYVDRKYPHFRYDHRQLCATKFRRVHYGVHVHLWLLSIGNHRGELGKQTVVEKYWTQILIILQTASRKLNQLLEFLLENNEKYVQLQFGCFKVNASSNAKVS